MQPTFIKSERYPPSSATNDSPWSPLREPLFRALWLASVVSSVGTWMHEAGAAWLMMSLTSSPLMMALMQTASTLPVLILGLPAGALADLLDRRKLLLMTQAWMLFAAGALALLTFYQLTDPWLLLVLTFALGVGAAINSPAWQSAVIQLVPRDDLPAAVALTGMGLNLARALGPAFGGALVALAGAPAVFCLNAISFLVFIMVLYRWRGTPERRAPLTEPVLRAIRTGVRYVRHAPGLRAVLVRTSSVVPFASALWALLPTLARQKMALDACSYGILLGSVGAGAVCGALFLPRLRKRFSLDRLVARATIVFAVALLALAVAREFALLLLILVAAGAAWMALMASFSIATQITASPWIRARAVALFLLVVQGGMAGGSVLWGALAEHAGTQVALTSAAGGLIICLWTAARYPLHVVTTPQRRPALRGGESPIDFTPLSAGGPGTGKLGPHRRAQILLDGDG